MIEYFNPTGIDTYQNIIQTDGQLIHALNVYQPGVGVLAKRPGNIAFLNNPDSAQVQNLFAFGDQNGTTLNLYRASGSLLYYSAQGTANWTICGNGTINNLNHVGHTILNNTMIIGDGAGSTRHTTNPGTSFTNTTNAPVAQYFTQYHQRVYASDGTSSVLTYSSYGSADNWNIAVPADSSSFVVPDEGAIGPSFVAGDRLNITKTRGKMYIWDETSLIDTTTKFGPTVPWSIGNIDENWYYVNQMGIFQTDGATRTVLSNAIQNQFYNSQGLGASDQQFIKNGYGYGDAHKWDYFVSVGTLTDSFVGRQINNAIIKYDYQKNTFVNWAFPTLPTAIHSYIDTNYQKQLIWGDVNGNVYQLSPTATSDNGVPIPSEAVFLFTYASQYNTFSPTSAQTIFGSSYEKKWNWLRLFFQPGNEVNIQYAFSNGMNYQHLKWSEAINTRTQGAPNNYWQVSDGVVEIRFPTNDPNFQPRSRFLFLRIYDDSDSSQWVYRGAQIDAEIQDIK